MRGSIEVSTGPKPVAFDKLCFVSFEASLYILWGSKHFRMPSSAISQAPEWQSRQIAKKLDTGLKRGAAGVLVAKFLNPTESDL